MPIVVPTNVMMVYGQGGMGKSTLGAQLAAWIFKTTGKKTRVVNMDGGGTRNAHAYLAEKEISSIWDLDQWDEKALFLTLDLASKGWWPEDPSEPNSALLPPFSKWKECPTCQKDVGAQGYALPPRCITCGATLAAGTFCRTRTTYANGFDAIGAVVFEGFTSFGEALLRRLRSINPEGGRTINDKGADGSTFAVAAPGQQHYGDAQAYLAQYVANSKAIPTGVVLWTALENRGEEDGKQVYGPKGPGQALTTTCIPWFTDVLHLDGVAKTTAAGLVVKDANGQEIVERKLFLAPHYPADNKLFLFRAKTSAPLAGGMPSLLDFPVTGNTVERLFGTIAAAKTKAGEEALK